MQSSSGAPAIIGVDARELAPGRAGVGRYLRESLRAMSAIPSASGRLRFALFSPERISSEPFLESPMFERRDSMGGSSASFFLAGFPFAARRRRVNVLWCPGYMAPPVCSGKVALTICDVSFERHPEWFSPKHRLAFGALSRLSAARADRILTISEFSRAEISEVYRVPPSRIVFVPLGLDDRFRRQTDSERAGARRFLESIGVRGEFLLTYGQLFTRRHVIESMRAFAEIAPRHPDLQFLIAGRDATFPPQNVDAVAAGLNRSLGCPAIVRAPYLPEEILPAILASARALVWLSEYEGFGYPPLESLFCGTPPVIGDYAVRSETVGDRAIVVRTPGDVGEIAGGMIRAIEDESVRREILRDVESLRGRFSWRVSGEKLLAALADLAADD